MTTEHIVAAAIQVPVDVPEGYELELSPVLIITKPPPARHHHLMHLYPERRLVHAAAQGFITNTGRFVERDEALRLAVAAGQLVPQGRRTLLYSEDLW